jgi:hypothetical protein
MAQIRFDIISRTCARDGINNLIFKEKIGIVEGEGNPPGARYHVSGRGLASLLRRLPVLRRSTASSRAPISTPEPT